MKIFGVTADNDEWHEDRSSFAAIVAAPDSQTALEIVKEYGEPLSNCRCNYDVEEISNLKPELEESQLITYFLNY